MMRHAAAFSLLLLLSGCLSAVDRLAMLEPSSDNFASALAAEYLGYSRSEEEQGRPETAEYYAGKGLRALDGEVVEPEQVYDTLAAKDHAAVKEARMHLKTFLNDDIKSVAPQKLARAQLFFDCWQQQLAGPVMPDMASCSEEFTSAMDALQEVEDAFEYNNEFQFTVAFARGSSEIDDVARGKIKEIAAMVGGIRHYRLEVRSYLGIRTSQRKLVRTRLALVEKALIDAGVRKVNMQVTKYGHANAVILSEDKLAPDTKKIYITVKTYNPAKQDTGE